MGPGSFLEIGCGRGDLLPELARLGFYGVALEIAPEAAATAREAISQLSHIVTIVEDPTELDGRRFHYGLAFEVLEHIDDDEGALRRWNSWIEPGGFFLLSVPAHMKHWTGADEDVGHYRRYDRDGLRSLLEKTGFEVVSLLSYGFPLTTLTRRWRSTHTERIRVGGNNLHERTLRSSFASEIPASGAAAVAISGLAWMGHLVQLGFLKTDLGDGYFAICSVQDS
jgi:SAM-dependent methyltransferase